MQRCESLRPVLRLLSSPTHIIFQLVRLTTLPYMIYHIINNKRQLSSKIETEIEIETETKTEKEKEKENQLLPLQVDLLFKQSRSHILNTLKYIPTQQQHHNNTSIAWQAEAMAQVVQQQSTTSKSKQQARYHAFLAKGPPQCDCQRSQLSLKVIPITLDQVGTLKYSSTLSIFAQNLNNSLSPITILRIVDLSRQAQRWDLAVIFLDRSLLEPTIINDPQLSNRRSGQVTALLHFLRQNGRPEPILDPLKLWCIHFICQCIEHLISSKKFDSYQWTRINRLTLDVITRFASMPIGFNHRHHPHLEKKHQKQEYPCLDLDRHRILLDSITSSTNELQFAVLTRERCERLLSQLARLVHSTPHHPSSSSKSQHPWTRRSDIQLRLLEYLAKQGTQDQFMRLLQTHIQQHPLGSPKLARIILLGARRFEDLSGNPDLIREMLTQLNQLDQQRPVIDFILRPRQPLETLKTNLEICLANLPQQREPRMQIYSHLLYRCSQLPSPSLALKVWDIINRNERRRCLVRVGRRSRAKLKQLLHSSTTDPMAVTVASRADSLSQQAIRSMIYVYKNLTHSSSPSSSLSTTTPGRRLAVGKNFRVLYQRLRLKGSHKSRWPLSRVQARSLMVTQLVQSELGRGTMMRDYLVMRALERTYVSSSDLNGFEGLLRRFLSGKMQGAEALLLARLAHLDHLPYSSRLPHRFFRLLSW
ncbi:hypothetical protein VP01_758g3 [Puccinia sorghi]|uniref:Uncharacterized protein n=1 Tax=Puccinia sorghi TaxID=27349 RepID=A0A0L6UC18_9BASI|nr:hypothetical protein VP01_758g3 [Puccinia sorghi]